MQLAKGGTANVAKDGEFPVFKLGASWEKRGKKLFGLFGGGAKSVDLDLCTFAVSNGRIVKECHFQNKTKTGYMIFGKDDMGGGGNKEKDNEITTLITKEIPENIDAIIMIINSFSGEKFDEIDFAKVRVYEGEDNKPTKMHCEYTVSSDESFSGGRTLIVGSISRADGGWNFNAIGDMRQYQYIEDFKREVQNV